MIFAVFILMVALFGFVLAFGAPYLPTRRKETQAALDLLSLKKGQTLYDLGCGDGRVLKMAARQGLNGVGYELNPLLVLVAKIYTYKYRHQVKIVWGNFWKADISKADGIFIFLIERFMRKLDLKLQKEVRKPVRVVSFAFKIPDRKIEKNNDGMHLYKY
jgi:SAM-dependent methyltransferase